MVSPGCLLPLEEYVIMELPRDQGTDNLLFANIDQAGNKLIVMINKQFSMVTQSWVYLHLSDENITYTKKDLNRGSSDGWYTGNMVFELVEPMKIWRIVFTGLLENTSSKVPDKHHIKFYFLWHPTSCPVFYNNSAAVSFYSEDNSFNTGYEQWGMMHGKIHINENFVTELNMRSLRRRYWCSDRIKVEETACLIAFGTDGKLFSVHTSEKGTTGHIRLLKEHILANNCETQNPFIFKSNVTIDISDGTQYNLAASFDDSLAYYLNGMSVRITTCEINEKSTEGFFFYHKRNLVHSDTNETSLYIFPNEIIDTDETTLVDLQDEICLNSTLVGGKAASLAKLNFCLKKKYFDFTVSDQMLVPTGFCVTINAMEEHINRNLELKEMLGVLEIGFSEMSKTAVSFYFQRLSYLWNSSEIDPNLRMGILTKIDKTKLYAVRSSGILEDTSDFSFAGQNDTFLNVSGEKNILEAVKNCWSSLYLSRSVQYRRECGLELSTKMAVIIQEMVEPKLAGVLFTQNPTSGDPRQIVISSVFGLGESVVSGTSESDTVYVDKENMKILQTHLCNSLVGNQNEKYNILENEAVKLSSIAVELERVLNGPLDIEWAIDDNVVCLLQCRPITTNFKWTDFEIAHELDSPYKEDDATTFYNCGEGLSGVTSPLYLTFNNPIMQDSFFLNEKDRSRSFFTTFLTVVQFRVGLNLFNTLLGRVEEKIPFHQQIIDIITCGKSITTESMYKLAQLRNGISKPGNGIWTFVKEMFRIFLTSSSTVRKAVTVARDFKIDVNEYKDAKILFAYINQHADMLKQVSDYHLRISSNCNTFQTLTLCTLSKQKAENLPQSFSTLSAVLSQCKDVVSTDILKHIQRIVNTILEGRGAEFGKISPEEGIEWLEKNNTLGYEELMNFLSLHGCRGINELDLMSKTWAMNPSSVIEMLQAIVAVQLNNVKSEPKQSESVPDILRKQHHNTNIIEWYIMCWLLSSCQNAVTNREMTKKCLIEVIHQFRLAFIKLSLLLVQKNTISNPEDVFFCTFYELYQLVNQNSTNRKQHIIHKIMRRRRLWNQLGEKQFPNVIIGLPKEKQNNFQDRILNQCNGFALSPNNAKGRACVLKGIDEAPTICHGDILVTKCIDIGWSPFFPILAGIVTELGGVMSHGAVVAREYGLPCLISVSDATSVFETGDTLFISGSEGVVKKLIDTES